MMQSNCLGHSLLRFKLALWALLLFGMVIASSPAAFSQGGTGAINGTISDTSGAVIPKAKVTLTNTANGAQRSVVSNDTGTYVFPGVIPGTYNVEVTADGFNTSKIAELKIEVNQTVTQNFSLAVGSTKQEVTVEASVVHIESSTAELGTAIATREVNDLPLNGRNFTQLLTLTPGISPISTAQNAGGGSNWGGNTIGSFTFPSVNGQSNRSNEFLLDGFNDGQVFMGMVGTTPIIDGLQEFKVQSHNDSSVYGGVLGGIVNVASKVGTNQYHGDAWEFLRNNDLDARNYFIADTIPYKQNQFGATVGGPIIPGKFRGGAPKSWFFAAYEGYRSVRSNSALINVPTPAEMGGDLSALTGTQIFNPYSTRPDPANPGSYLRDPFMCDNGGNSLPVTAGTLSGSWFQAAGTPCNKIPSSLINSSLVKYVQADLPTPINTNVAGTNAIDTTPNRIRQDTASLRLDHQFSENTSAWLRYTGFTQPDSFAVSWPGSTSYLYDHGYQGAVQVTHTFGGGSKVLSAGFGRNDAQTNNGNHLGVPANLWETVGFSPAYADIFHQSKELNPSVTYSGFNTRPGAKIQYTHMSDVYEGKTDFTWVHSRHTMQMGADFATDNTQSPIEYIDENYSTAQTANPEAAKGVVTGAGLASFLLGTPDNADYRNVHETTHGGWIDGFYFQDSWKATSKLTVNVGARYDVMLMAVYGSPADHNQYEGDLDLDHGQYILSRMAPACNPSSGVGAPCIPGGTLPANVIVTPFSGGRIYHHTFDNLGPRVGLAYQVRPNTVVRAAFGKFFDTWQSSSQLAQNYEGTWPDLGQLIGNNFDYPTSTNPLPTVNWADPFNAAGGSVPLPGPTPFNQVQWYMDPRAQNPYSEQWNLGIQQSLGSSTVLEADYVGQHSSRLECCGDDNVAVTPGPGDGSAAVDPRRPYPYITPTYYDKSIGKASYNGFQFKLRRNTTKGLSYIISYTWSKVINLGCDGSFGAEGCNVQQIYDFKANRSVAGFDIPHLLNANATYDLPFGTGRQFASGNKMVNALIGHWGLNGIFTIRSGEPFTVGVNGDIPNVGGSNNVRANIVGPAIPGTRTWQTYLNTASFQVPAEYTFGDTGRNAFRLGSLSNIDMSLMRDFPIPLGEATRLQFRMEAFNAINHAVLGGCLDGTVQDANFGIANCTRNTEREVQFALKLYF